MFWVTRIVRSSLLHLHRSSYSTVTNMKLKVVFYRPETDRQTTSYEYSVLLGQDWRLMYSFTTNLYYVKDPEEPHEVVGRRGMCLTVRDCRSLGTRYWGWLTGSLLLPRGNLLPYPPHLTGNSYETKKFFDSIPLYHPKLRQWISQSGLLDLSGKVNIVSRSVLVQWGK